MNSNQGAIDPLTRHLTNSTYQLLKPLGQQKRLFVGVDISYTLLSELRNVPASANQIKSLCLNVPDKSLFMAIPTDSNGGNPVPLFHLHHWIPQSRIEPIADPIFEAYATMVDEDDLENDLFGVEAEVIDLAEANIIQDLPTPSAPSGEFTEDLTFESNLL